MNNNLQLHNFCDVTSIQSREEWVTISCILLLRLTGIRFVICHIIMNESLVSEKGGLAVGIPPSLDRCLLLYPAEWGSIAELPGFASHGSGLYLQYKLAAKSGSSWAFLRQTTSPLQLS